MAQITAGSFGCCCVAHCLALIGASWLESRAGIIQRPSLFDPDVPISVHPALDNLLFAHVDVIMTTFVYCYKVYCFPITMISVYVM
jgi:hypothetical protein